MIKTSKILLASIILILLLTSCKNNSRNDYSFEKVQIAQSNLFLTLPIGIDSNEIEDFTEGIYQQFKYSDNSIVLISTNGMGQINLSESKNDKVIERKELIDGIQIAYFITKKERKGEFDQAFDKMIENGLK